jgi:hypothetical protein
MEGVSERSFRSTAALWISATLERSPERLNSGPPIRWLVQGVKDRRRTFVDESDGVTNKQLDGRYRPKTIQSPWREAEWLLRDNREKAENSVA